MRSLHRLLAVSAICLLFVVVACSASLPLYPATGLPDPVSMKPYTVDKAQFSLPPGWTFEPHDPNKPVLTGFSKMLTGKGVVGMLKKESKGDQVGGALALFCWGGFVGKASMPEIANDSILKSMPDAVIVKAHEVESEEGPNPLLQIYSGTVTTEGKKALVYGYAGSKWTAGFGCRYTVSGFAPVSAGDPFERDFVAILRSLKN